MKEIIIKRIDYLASDPCLKLKTGALVKMLQEAAVSHSESVGLGMRSLIEGNKAWVMRKLALEILFQPEYGDEIEIQTWSAGISGPRAKRNFKVIKEGKTLASASSEYLLIDTEKKKLRRASKEMEAIYTRENEVALDSRLKGWKPETCFTHEEAISIITRSSDYDPLGHVNNAVYLDYLAAALERKEASPISVIKSFRIQFFKEIDFSKNNILIGLSPGKDTRLFRIYDENDLFAAGEVSTLTPVSIGE